MLNEYRRAATAIYVDILDIREVMWFEKLDFGMHRNPAHAQAYLHASRH
jgi:hypothetical protein